ncbi:MAG: TlpA family protein disulfide reductase [Deltaproteobacteria bacterium]|nr:TlpA family protein disulfide reductase [Deltaproteobacteria bacterium]
MKKLIIAVFVIGFMWCGLTGAEADNDIEDITQHPNITLLNGQGKKIQLNDAIKGEVSVVNFTTTWCLDCKRLASDLKEIIPRYSGKNVRFINVYLGVKQTIVGKLINYNKRFPGAKLLLDPDRGGSQQMGVSGMPHVVIFNASGEMKYERRSPSASELRSAIEKVIK